MADNPKIPRAMQAPCGCVCFMSAFGASVEFMFTSPADDNAASMLCEEARSLSGHALQSHWIEGVLAREPVDG